MIGWIGHISHHLRSILSAIELTVLCVFVSVVEYFDDQIRETLLYKYWFKLLASLGKCNYLFTRNKMMKQLAFFIISSTPSLRNIAQISNQFFGQLNLLKMFSIFLP